MPTPSAIDLLKKEIPAARWAANKDLKQSIEYHKPKGRGEKAEPVETALRNICRELSVCHETVVGIFSQSIRIKTVPPLNAIRGNAEEVQRALSLLEDAFSTHYAKNTVAEKLIVQIAQSHARFHAQMMALLDAVKQLAPNATKARTTPPPMNVVQKPAPRSAEETPEAAVTSLHDTPFDTESAATEGERQCG